MVVFTGTTCLLASSYIKNEYRHFIDSINDYTVLKSMLIVILFSIRIWTMKSSDLSIMYTVVCHRDTVWKNRWHAVIPSSLAMTSPIEFWNASLEFFGNGNRRIGDYHTSADQRIFRAFFGCSPVTCAAIWNRLDTWQLHRTDAKPKCLLCSLLFLKQYPIEPICATLSCFDEKTFRKWAWIYTELIAVFLYHEMVRNLNTFLCCCWVISRNNVYWNWWDINHFGWFEEAYAFLCWCFDLMFCCCYRWSW